MGIKKNTQHNPSTNLVRLLYHPEELTKKALETEPAEGAIKQVSSGSDPFFHARFFPNAKNKRHMESYTKLETAKQVSRSSAQPVV